ncbi:MAG: hypothetical protein K6G68_08550 [Oscillospiraceae bacterium]|nr:hypothetical protein [Oscillospiraceae bacterium]
MNRKFIAIVSAALMSISMSVSVSAIDLPFVPVDDGSSDSSNPSEGENNGGSTGNTELGPINNGETIPAPPTPSDPVQPAPEPSYIPAPSYTDDNYHPSGSSTPGYSTAPSYSTTPLGGYTVNYNTEPAYYPAPTAFSTGTSKKISLNITARTDSSGNITLEWEKVRKADKYTVYYLSGKRYTKIGSTAKTTYTVTDIEPDSTYRFMVRYSVEGVTSGVNDSFKISVTVKKADLKPSKPVVTAYARNGTVTLRWNAVEGAEKYAIYRYGSKLKKVTTTTGTSAKIKQKPSDRGYAVKAYVNGKWTTINASDIVTV